MRIEFCSLCDESVPLPDLDKGIAVKTKGRIICANCESAMSTDALASPASPLAFMGSEPPVGASLETGGDTTMMDTSAPAPRGRPKRPAQDGALGGMLFAAFTLLVIGAVSAGFHFYDQYKLERSAADLELVRLGEQLKQNNAVQERRMNSAVRVATSDLPAALKQVAQLEASMARMSKNQTDSLGEMQLELNGVKRKLSSLDVVLERLDGNERDLGQVAASLADVFDDVLGIQRRLDSAEAIAASIPVQEIGDGAPAVVAKAAWQSQLSGLDDLDPGTRWLAVTAIGEFGDPACAPHVIPRLKDEDVFVRMAAARILGEVRATSAIESLIDALEDEQNTVRQAAMLALRSLTGESLKFNADEKPAVRQKRVKAWRDWWKKNKSKFEAA